MKKIRHPAFHREKMQAPRLRAGGAPGAVQAGELAMSEDKVEQGRKVRAEVLGPSYVNSVGPTPTKFQKAFQEFTTEYCWGNVWIRPGLDRKTRSMLNLAMLSAMARWHEFEV